MKNPGAEWYESLVRKSALNFVFSKLLWQHREFFRDKVNYGKRLLDIGCGLGAFLSKAKKRGYKVFGIDINRDTVAVAKKRYGLEGVYAIDEKELYDHFIFKKFDVITFFEVLEHLDDPTQFIVRVKKILKCGGYIVLSVPNRDRVKET
ncbi:unnamed protein product, partial [marine sediment metagenome]